MNITRACAFAKKAHDLVFVVWRGLLSLQGIGGFRLGLESIGGRCVLMAEQDRFCHLTVRKNFSEDGVAIRSVSHVCC